MAINKVIIKENTFLDLTSDTVSENNLLDGEKAHGIDGQPIIGGMPNNGGVSGTISTKDGQYTIAKGYHDGTGKVSIDSAEQGKIIASNIRNGVTVLGVTGTMSGLEGVKPQIKTVTPSSTVQTVSPDAGYTHLSQVTVAAIPYKEEANSAGGITVTIG